MKTLLVAVDFSDASSRILSIAVELANALSSRITLLHVVEPMASYVPVGAAMDVVETVPPPVAEEDLKNQQAQLARLAADFPGVEIESVCVIGLAADEIIGQAADRAASHIVLGSHGHGALYHLFAGSVVTGVLKRSTVPVVVVPIGDRS